MEAREKAAPKRRDRAGRRLKRKSITGSRYIPCPPPLAAAPPTSSFPLSICGSVFVRILSYLSANSCVYGNSRITPLSVSLPCPRPDPCHSRGKLFRISAASPIRELKQTLAPRTSHQFDKTLYDFRRCDVIIVSGTATGTYLRSREK